MTNNELIAIQAKQIGELREKVADLKQSICKARMHIYCIGGPLNDNKLNYSAAQKVTFLKIDKELT